MLRTDGSEVREQSLKKKGQCKAKLCELILSKDYSDRKVGIKSRLPGRLSREIGFWNERKAEEAKCLVM